MESGTSDDCLVLSCFVVCDMGALATPDQSTIVSVVAWLAFTVYLVTCFEH